MCDTRRLFLSGDEAVAQAAHDAGVDLGTGYPGTPSTEILEHLGALGGRAQWAPNEKVALEVGLGVAFGRARALVTMKHVGLNVAADALFTAAYTELDGGLVVVSADDPGMSSSQNEQDNRHYAVAAGVPMVEPADPQEAYTFTRAAFEMSERWRVPVLLRMTTRVCHSKAVVYGSTERDHRPSTGYERNLKGRVMIPGHARPAHHRMRDKLARIEAWNDTCDLHGLVDGDHDLGIITSGVAYLHAREAAPNASVLKLAVTYPLPMHRIRRFVESVGRCVVIEEGDPWLVTALRAEGMAVAGKPEMYRFGELNVERVRRIIADDTSPEAPAPSGKPPELCKACPHRASFTALSRLDCIVAGDIGCYSLGVLPPFEAMDTLVCMGASIGVGLGLRHVLPEDQARRVVSVIGDSTFMHSGVTGLIEMVYNPPPTGHVVLILDNSTTAMTGLQEHPGTGRTLTHEPTGKIHFERLVQALGITHSYVYDPVADPQGLEPLLAECLAGNDLSVIIVRRTCLLAAGKVKEYERVAAVTSGEGTCEEQEADTHG